MTTLRRIPTLLLCGLLLAALPAQAQERQECLNPFPIINPVHPGACFINTDLGIFLNLDDADGEFVDVETFGGVDSFIRVNPRNRRVRTHDHENDAEVIYCPADVTGPDCSPFFGIPGPGAWSGTGKFTVNTDLDDVFIDNIFIQNFTCPSTIVGRGVVTDPDGNEHDLRVLIIWVKKPDGECYAVHNDIAVSP